jgi:hypothetical protein
MISWYLASLFSYKIFIMRILPLLFAIMRIRPNTLEIDLIRPNWYEKGVRWSYWQKFGIIFAKPQFLVMAHCPHIGNTVKTRDDRLYQVPFEHQCLWPDVGYWRMGGLQCLQFWSRIGGDL